MIYFAVAPRVDRRCPQAGETTHQNRIMLFCLDHSFCDSRVQVEAFKSAGFLHRKSLQYHWRNRDRRIDSSSTVNNNNNGAGIATTATDSTVVLGAASTTPSEEAQRVVNAAREGNDGSSTKKYVDFDSYLGNFASKRRIKVGVFGDELETEMGFFVTAGGMLCEPPHIPAGGGCRSDEKASSSPHGE